MPNRMLGNQYRSTVVCIDKYGDCECSGRLYNPFLPQAIGFASLMQLLLTFDRLLDEMHFPQSFVDKRTFSTAPPTLTEAVSASEQKGKLGTFSVRVLFRQNASWQGSVTWLETNQEESFRSVLELLVLMNSALSGAAAP